MADAQAGPSTRANQKNEKTAYPAVAAVIRPYSQSPYVRVARPFSFSNISQDICHALGFQFGALQASVSPPNFAKLPLTSRLLQSQHLRRFREPPGRRYSTGWVLELFLQAQDTCCPQVTCATEVVLPPVRPMSCSCWAVDSHVLSMVTDVSVPEPAQVAHHKQKPRILGIGRCDHRVVRTVWLRVLPPARLGNRVRQLTAALLVSPPRSSLESVTLK